MIGIHQRLTERKYRGNLILKYEFQVEDVPQKYSLVVEQPQLYRISVNGSEINFEGKDYYRDHALANSGYFRHFEKGCQRNRIIAQLCGP